MHVLCSRQASTSSEEKKNGGERERVRKRATARKINRIPERNSYERISHLIGCFCVIREKSLHWLIIDCGMLHTTTVDYGYTKIKKKSKTNLRFEQYATVVVDYVDDDENGDVFV